MTGTLINTGGIIAGALIGMLLRRGIPRRLTDPVLQVEGLAILVIALNGVIASMFQVDSASGKLSDSGGLLLLVSLVLGTFVGELLRIHDHLDAFSAWMEKRLRAEGFAKGFVTASLLFCVGAMSIIGPLNDGLRGDYSILLLKTALDFTTAIILASTLGVGVLFAAVPVLVLQGGVALAAQQISAFVSDDLLRAVCMVGYVIVFAMGLNFLRSEKIKTANLLPALLCPIAYHFLSMLG